MCVHLCIYMHEKRTYTCACMRSLRVQRVFVCMRVCACVNEFVNVCIVCLSVNMCVVYVCVCVYLFVRNTNISWKIRGVISARDYKLCWPTFRSHRYVWFPHCFVTLYSNNDVTTSRSQSAHQITECFCFKFQVETVTPWAFLYQISNRIQTWYTILPYQL